jgi:hypothetical protein
VHPIAAAKVAACLYRELRANDLLAGQACVRAKGSPPRRAVVAECVSEP